ncbi:Retrovirus-related Pol polyprotein from transposon TNT 1-94 [Senna tora]|uniref:Retrovirus-related Pol polyprotein from transposon TNT 1-94 n=1 Tax=Senna tora TaxID=362788 RepID=A0A834WEI4_9FABA|nr:Retrovirus-related Pol polyprotein from transposon TNT 1-94 [Senna tora]
MENSSSSSSTASLVFTSNAISQSNSIISFNHPISVKLEERNFLIWRQQVLAAIRGHDLEGFLIGGDRVPAKYENTDAEKEGKVSSKFIQWMKQDQLLLSWLCYSMSEGMQTKTVGCTSCAQVWMKIEEYFASNTLAKANQFRTELSNTKKGTRTMNEYLLRIKAIVDALIATGNSISEREHVEIESLLLSQELRIEIAKSQAATPETLSANVASVENSNTNQNQNTNNTGGSNNNNSNFQNNRGGGRNNNNRGRGRRGRGGFGGYGNYNNGGFNNNFPRGPVCQLCSRPGHVVFQCYQRFNTAFQPYAPNAYAPQVRNQVNMAAMNNAYSDGGWYPDSGATSHVTSDFSNLADRSNYTGGDQLVVGNGKGLYISHIGHSSVISPFNPHTTLHLNSLLHVPHITKNLVSVSKFARDNNVFFEFHPSVCLVKSQASKAVLFQGTIKDDGLYAFDNFQLQHLPSISKNSSSSTDPSTSHSKAFTNSVCLASVQSLDEYKLWHYRLGHPHSSVLNNVLHQNNISVGRLYISRDVIFNEQLFPFASNNVNPVSTAVPFASGSTPSIAQYVLHNTPLPNVQYQVLSSSAVMCPDQEVKADSLPPVINVPFDSSNDTSSPSPNTSCHSPSATRTTPNSSATSSTASVPSACDSVPTAAPCVTNQHPMVTRSKNGVFKPKALVSITEPKTIQKWFLFLFASLLIILPHPMLSPNHLKAVEATQVGGRDSRNQDVGVGRKNYGAPGNHNNMRGEKNSNDQNETVEPNYYSSSIYYGGQENYSPRTRTTDQPHPIFKKDKDDDDDPNDNNSNTAARGNWWQGIGHTLLGQYSIEVPFIINFSLCHAIKTEHPVDQDGDHSPYCASSS